jgi:acyl-CoA synthetase (AMP-forming)/AMP-acid ligase II
VIELLLAAAEKRPDEVAVISPFGRSTYAELAERAQSVGAELRARDIRRFGVIDPDPAVVLTLLAGSALAGSEACIYPVAANNEAVADMAGRFDHAVVVTDRDLDLGAGTALLSPEQLTGSTAPRIAPAADPRPLMVMTTGTSGVPRGVQHQWDRALRIAHRIRPEPDQRWVLAYGANQFGGLQILIHVLAAQACLVAATSFQPRDALTAMREHGVTHASGTPTFWRFLLSEMRSDRGPVPRLQQVTLGGEAVPGQLLERLAEVFPDANVSQVYAASEFGHAITVRDGKPGLPLEVLGENDSDVQLKVVDGELFVRSRASMRGYYADEEVRAQDWRATGDLVEEVDGRVLFRGRKTDIVNVGGVKVHPLPVEERVSRVPGVALARVHGRPNARTGAIVAVEVVLEPGADADEVRTAIRAACADLPPAARPRSVKVVDFLTTTGNKMIRRVST